MFYIYWDTELVAAVSQIGELVSELVDANITGYDAFEFIFLLSKYHNHEQASVVQMSDGSKHKILVQCFYAEDHVPYGFKELPF